MKERKKAIINIILLVLTLVINALGAFGFINGNSQKEVSDRYLTLITPSPSTFSIWSIIYGLLIVSGIVMIIKSDDNFWANTILVIAVIFVFLVNLKNKNAIFPLPIAWAFYGINNFLKSPEGFPGMYPIIEKVTIGGIIALLIISIYRLYKNNYKIIPSN